MKPYKNWICDLLKVTKKKSLHIAHQHHVTISFSKGSNHKGMSRAQTRFPIKRSLSFTMENVLDIVHLHFIYNNVITISLSKDGSLRAEQQPAKYVSY